MNPQPQSNMNNSRHLSQQAGVAGFTLHELFELASLDAMGLLEEAERRQFEDAFRSLPPAAQAQIRDQQSRIADHDATLPVVQCPPLLRQRVLDAVAAEIELGAPVPIARITPVIARSRSVNPIWRAAAIGCAAAAIVFGVTTLQMNAQYRGLERQIASNAIGDLFIKEFGPRFETAFLSRGTQFIQFNPINTPANGAEPMAVILLDPQTRSAQLYCKDLPDREGLYKLVIVDPTGRAGNVILTFRAGGQRVAEIIGKLDVAAGSTLGIAMEASEDLLLKSSNL